MTRGSTPDVKRAYSRDYKLRIVKQILLGQMSIAQICRENNLGENGVRHRFVRFPAISAIARWLRANGGIFHDALTLSET
jgi:hypothetical protein